MAHEDLRSPAILSQGLPDRHFDPPHVPPVHQAIDRRPPGALSRPVGAGAQQSIDGRVGLAAAVDTALYVREVRAVLAIDGCLLYTSDAADEEDSVDLG